MLDAAPQWLAPEVDAPLSLADGCALSRLPPFSANLQRTVLIVCTPTNTTTCRSPKNNLGELEGLTPTRGLALWQTRWTPG